MNLPNKLTLFRVIIIPAMIIVACIDVLENTIFLDISIANFVNAILFVVASLTDFLDGAIARKNNLVTTFGKFADPLADKLLVLTALLIFVEQGVIPAWIVIIILSREFIVTGIRLVSVEKGVVIAASSLAKYKTASTMVALVVLFFSQSSNYILWTGNIILYIALVLTVVSGIDYFLKNKKNILESI